MVSPVEGTPFGRCRLIELLGRGGMGEVWRAYDTVTDRVVAIKVLHAHMSDDEEFQRRFRREAHAAARLNTPHVGSYSQPRRNRRPSLRGYAADRGSRSARRAGRRAARGEAFSAFAGVIKKRGTDF